MASGLPPAAVLPKPVAPHEEKDNTLHLVLREVEIQKLYKIDVPNQTFMATIWMEFVIPDGALDERLCAGMDDRPPTGHFPIDPTTGRPTFRPSATWFMEQVDARNALTWRLRDGKVMRRGSDLIMAIRLEGTFVEIYELTDYPFDCQGLTMTLAFNCRANGPLPIDISIKEQCTVTMTCMKLCPPIKEYELKPYVYIRPHLVGTGECPQTSRSTLHCIAARFSPCSVFIACVCAQASAPSQGSASPPRSSATHSTISSSRQSRWASSPSSPSSPPRVGGLRTSTIVRT